MVEGAIKRPVRDGNILRWLVVGLRGCTQAPNAERCGEEAAHAGQLYAGRGGVLKPVNQ